MSVFEKRREKSVDSVSPIIESDILVNDVSEVASTNTVKVLPSAFRLDWTLPICWPVDDNPPSVQSNVDTPSVMVMDVWDQAKSSEPSSKLIESKLSLVELDGEEESSSNTMVLFVPMSDSNETTR